MVVDSGAKGYRGPNGWQTQIEEIKTTEAMGKRFLALTQASPGDTQAIRYGWASVLLAADGNTSFFAANEYVEDTWSKEYEASLGEPVSSAYPAGDGTWRRVFTRGLVVVNPTGTATRVSFGGTYSGSGLTRATGTVLAPDSALVLVTANVGNEASRGSTSDGEGGGSALGSGGLESELGNVSGGSSGAGTGRHTGTSPHKKRSKSSCRRAVTSQRRTTTAKRRLICKRTQANGRRNEPPRTRR